MSVMMIQCRFLAVCAALAVLHVAVPGAAKPKKKDAPSSQEKESESEREARRLYKDGDRLYAEGDYEGAVAAFEKAFELSNRPALKYNLANAYERLGKYDAALKALREYQPHAAAAERDVLDRRIKKLEDRVAQQQSAKPEVTPEKQAPAPTPTPTPTPVAGTPQPQQAAEQPSGGAPTLGYVLLGVGVVGVGVGAFFGIQALSERSNAEELCPETSGGRRCSTAAEDALAKNKSNALIADISIGVGLAAAAVGTYIVITHGSKERPASTFIRARATHGGAGGELSLVGKF